MGTILAFTLPALAAVAMLKAIVKNKTSNQ
jgi:hypothetical protein